MFEVAVGDSTPRVVEGNEATLDVLGEGLSPDVGGTSGVKVDPTHAGFGCIGSTEETGVLRDNLGEVGRTGRR